MLTFVLFIDLGILERVLDELVEGDCFDWVLFMSVNGV